ncbi:MAG: Hsp20/alpha crystallin family protein [Chloroflexi bacterium]|nr:Hsp20/alpha crystallin family protein [Chloroflexota bacterium]
MSLTRWNPFRDMISLRDAMNMLMEDSFIQPRSMGNWGMGNVPLDIYEQDGNLVVKASIPGVKPEDLNIQVQNDILTISGEMRHEDEKHEQNYQLQEHRFGRFERTVRLGCPVQADKAEAKFENGVLTLTLPEAEEARPKRIQVQTSGEFSNQIEGSVKREGENRTEGDGQQQQFERQSQAGDGQKQYQR